VRDCVPPTDAGERLDRAVRMMLTWAVLRAVRRTPAVLLWKRMRRDSVRLAPLGLRASRGPISDRAALLLAISSLKSMWALKKKESLRAIRR